MRTSKLAALSAVVLIALAGCGQADESGADTPAAATTSADPAARIDAAATTLGKGAYRYAIEAPIGKMTGVVHMPSDSQQMSASGKGEDGNELKVEFVEIGTDRWMKMDLGIDAGDDPVMKELAKEFSSWRHVSREEAAATFAVAEERIGTAAAALLTDATGLKETGSGQFAGTLDVTASPFLDLIGDAAEIKALGDKAKAVPVAITLDAEGRATSVVFDVPAGAKTPAYQAKITFSDYDKVEAPKAPPADQVKAS